MKSMRQQICWSVECKLSYPMLGLESAAIRSGIKMTIGASGKLGRRIIQKWPQPSVTKTKTDDGGELTVIEYRDRPQNQSFFELGRRERILESRQMGSLSNKRTGYDSREETMLTKIIFLSTIKVLDEFAYQQGGRDYGVQTRSSEVIQLRKTDGVFTMPRNYSRMDGGDFLLPSKSMKS